MDFSSMYAMLSGQGMPVNMGGAPQPMAQMGGPSVAQAAGAMPQMAQGGGGGLGAIMGQLGQAMSSQGQGQQNNEGLSAFHPIQSTFFKQIMPTLMQSYLGRY